MNPSAKLSLGVVILGAGASVRMGKPKLLLPWRGTTVIGRILAQWRQLGAIQIGIVARPNDAPLATELDRLRFPKRNRVENPQPERGMFSSIVCAANWGGWQKEITSWAIALGDQPHLKTETLRTLLEIHAQKMDAICQPTSGGHTAHPVILPRFVFAGLKLSSAATLKDFLNLAAAPRVLHGVDDAGLLLDMDTPEDYKRVLPR